MFGYEYVDLTPEQVELRRELLDRTGLRAYVFSILLVVGVYAYRTLIGGPSNPSDAGKPPSFLGAFSRKVSWILNTTYIDEFGPLQVQVLGLCYGAALVFQAMYQTGNDYMHVTKAFGHVAVSQLPLHYLLAMKYPSSPITLATGLTHERLNAYHRLFGRLIHALLATHAILYMRFFIAKDLLAKRIMDWDVRLGLMAFWSVNILAILALPPIRAKSYHKLFNTSHALLSTVLPFVLWFHVPYTRLYVGQAIVFLFANTILRMGSTQFAQVQCESVAKSLVRVKAKTFDVHLFPYLPGVHIYLTTGGFGPRTPFTVLSAKGLENRESHFELVAKHSGGPMTARLAAMSRSGRIGELQLEGPYGEAQQYMPELLDKKVVMKGKFLLVAGGVGATYALPIYKTLVEARGNEEGMRLLWIVQTEEDAQWGKKFWTDPQITSGFHIAVTQAKESENPFSGTEMAKSGRVSAGRPNFEEFVDSLVKQKSGAGIYEPLTVMVCGPGGLSKSLRKAVGKHVFSDAIDVRWYEEQFGFGGS